MGRLPSTVHVRMTSGIVIPGTDGLRKRCGAIGKRKRGGVRVVDYYAAAAGHAAPRVPKSADLAPCLWQRRGVGRPMRDFVIAVARRE